MTIPDKYAFWRWPAKIRRLSTELEQLKTEHQKVLAGQSAVLEWVKITHRLDSKAEGIRALIQQGKRIIPLLFLFIVQSLYAQPAPPILRQPLTTNSHFGPVPTEGQVPIWNATANKWSNGLISAGVSTPHTWTNDNGTLKPIAFPTNILFRVVVPDDGIGTNFYFDSRVYRTNGASKLFQIYNGGSNALTIGQNGQLMIGRGNSTPLPGAVLYGIFDTALGETNQQEIFTLSGNSAVGYSGAADMIVDTNYGALILFANKEGGTKFTRFSIQAGGGINPENFNNFTMQGLVDGATYFQVDPSFTLLTPTNYLFSSSVRITNTDTLMSLQNSNFPVLEVDGVGDLRLIKKVPYLWPSAQGAVGTVLTNNGSGALGWGAVVGNFQPASANLTNWSLYPTNVWNDRQFGSQNLTNWSNIPTGAMANVVSTTFLTNWANAISNYVTAATNSASVTNWITTRQPADAVLSNLVGTAARNVTNFISLSTTNATSKPLTNSYTAGVLTMFGIEQGSGHAITVNASNIVSANDWAQTASTTNVVGVSNWVNSVSNYVTSATNSASVTNWITQRQPASATLTNWSLYPTNVWNDRQGGSSVLTNLAGNPYTGYTNQVFGGTNTSVRTAGGTNFIDTTGFLNNWSLYSTNVWNDRQGGSLVLSNLVGTGAITNLIGVTNSPIHAAGNFHVTNQLLRVNENINGGTVFTNLDFTGSIIKTMTNAITGSRTNNLTNAVGGASMIVYVVGDTATATDFNYTFTAASANIRWMNSPTNANAIDVLIHSNQVYTFRFDVVTNATGPATNIIASWSTDSQRPILNRLLPVSAGAGTSNAWVEGRVFMDAITQTTNHTGTDNYTNLFTFTVPANTLTNEEDEVEFYLSGQSRFHTATTNSLKCIYGTATVFDTGFITASNCPWKAAIRITRTGNSAQRVEAEVRWNVNAAIGSFGNGTLSTYATNMPLAQVNGVTNIFVFQGKSRIPAAITNDYKLVRWNPGTRGSVP